MCFTPSMWKVNDWTKWQSTADRNDVWSLPTVTLCCPPPIGFHFFIEQSESLR